MKNTKKMLEDIFYTICAREPLMHANRLNHSDEDEDELDDGTTVHFSHVTHQLMRKESTSFLMSQRKLSEISEEENAESIRFCSLKIVSYFVINFFFSIYSDKRQVNE